MLAQFTSVVSSDSFSRLTRATLAEVVAASDDTNRDCGIIISLAQAKQQGNVKALIDSCIGATIIDHDGQTMIVNKQDDMDNQAMLAHKFGEVLALEETRDKQNKKIENNEKLLKLYYSKIEKLKMENSDLSLSILAESDEIAALKQLNSSHAEQLFSQHARIVELESLTSV